MQDQGNRALRRNSVEPFQIEGDRVGGESVHVSDRHCKSIDPGALDKVAGLERVGHGLRRKCIRGDVLVSRHRTEFSLDPGTGAMGECGRLVREADVVFEAQVRAVNHHRRVAGVEASLHFRQVPAVIEMHADRCCR